MTTIADQVIGLRLDAHAHERSPKLLTFSNEGFSQVTKERTGYVGFGNNDGKPSDTYMGIPYQIWPEQTEAVKLWCETDTLPDMQGREVYRMMHDLLRLAEEGLRQFQPNERFGTIKPHFRHVAHPITIGGRLYTLTLSET